MAGNEPASDRNGRGATRRGVLSAVAGGGAASVLASFGLDPADATDTLLGDFESDLDGWRAEGDLELSRVGRDARPDGVTRGRRALAVTAAGESAPTVSRAISAVDLASSPHFVAAVAPGPVEGTDAPVAFRFRLRESDGLVGGGSVLAESPPVTVRQAMPGQVYWDASDVATSALDAAARLELRWHPVGAADRPYHGTVTVDAVRASSLVDPVGSARFAARLGELQFEHGPYERTELDERSDTTETGRFVFADGATEPYRFDALDDDRFRATLAGTEARFGGGWR